MKNKIILLGLLTSLVTVPLMSMEPEKKTLTAVSDQDKKTLGLALVLAANAYTSDPAFGIEKKKITVIVPNKETKRKWFGAAQDGNIEVIRQMLKESFPVDVQDELGRTALMIITRKGNDKIAQLLVDNGASVDLQDETGVTALIIAAWGGFDKIVQILLGRGARVDLQDEMGMTALIWAAFDGHDKITQLLIGNRALLMGQIQESKTALMWAAANGHGKVVKLLLRNGVTVELHKLSNAKQLQQLIQQCQEEINNEKIVLLLTVAREYYPSVFDKDYLPLDLFRHILDQANLIKDFKHNHGPEKEDKEEIQTPNLRLSAPTGSAGYFGLSPSSKN